MALLGVHFFGEPGGALYGKAWGRATQRTLPVMDVAWCEGAYPGHGIDEALDRLTYQADWLWERGITTRPFLRLDLRPGLTIDDTAAYRDGADYAMRRWAERPHRPVLGLVCGNEFQLEGAVWPATVADATAWVAFRRQAQGYPVRVYAGAVAPHHEGLNPDYPAGSLQFYGGPAGDGRSAEWQNYQYALTHELRARGAPLQGQALHAYGDHVVHGYWEAEPATDYEHPQRPGCRRGFRAWRELMDACDRAWPVAGRDFVVTEVNCHWPWAEPSNVNYSQGWLPAALADLRARPRVTAALWFVGEDPSWRHDALADREGATNPGGGCAAADDDANAIWGVG